MALPAILRGATCASLRLAHARPVWQTRASLHGEFCLSLQASWREVSSERCQTNEKYLNKQRFDVLFWRQERIHGETQQYQSTMYSDRCLGAPPPGQTAQKKLQIVTDLLYELSQRSRKDTEATQPCSAPITLTSFILYPPNTHQNKSVESSDARHLLIALSFTTQHGDSNTHTHLKTRFVSFRKRTRNSAQHHPKTNWMYSPYNAARFMEDESFLESSYCRPLVLLVMAASRSGWEWSNGGMVLTGETEYWGGGTCPSATWKDLASNHVLRGDRPVTDRRNL